MTGCLFVHHLRNNGRHGSGSLARRVAAHNRDLVSGDQIRTADHHLNTPIVLKLVSTRPKYVSDPRERATGVVDC